MVNFNKDSAEFFKKNGIKFNVEKQGDDILSRKDVVKAVDVLGNKNDKQVNKMAPGFPQTHNPEDDILG